MFPEHTVAFAVGVIGNLISFLIFLAPVTIFYRIYKRKSTEGFPSVSYVIAHFSCMLWVYYALIKTDETLHITIHSFGVLIESLYIVIYLMYAPLQAKKFTAGMLIFLNVTVFEIILTITLLLFNGHKRLIMLGWICVAFSVIFFVAPLSIMRLVIRTKSVEFIPFNLSFLETISAAVWLGYGIMSKDIYIALPNILGLVFGIVKKVLYCIYRDVKQENSDDTMPKVTPVVFEDIKDEGVVV